MVLKECYHDYGILLFVFLGLYSFCFLMIFIYSQSCSDQDDLSINDPFDILCKINGPTRSWSFETRALIGPTIELDLCSTSENYRGAVPLLTDHSCICPISWFIMDPWVGLLFTCLYEMIKCAATNTTPVIFVRMKMHLCFCCFMYHLYRDGDIFGTLHD